MTTFDVVPTAVGTRSPALVMPPLCDGALDSPALVTAGRTLTYADLARRVESRRAWLGTTRRLVLLEATNDVETVVTFLAALAGRHPVLLAAPGDTARRADLLAHDPDVVQSADGRITEVRPGTRHDLHPDLAVLLSTSGSTGSAKLVRLTLANLRANASAIASYLHLTSGDRAITSLPLHYCYGLSVLTSHLHAGGSVTLTDLSVADACFWDLARSTGATSFAGVPYTFDLLEAAGRDGLDLPSLRYVTQAGGRMDADRIRRFSALGERQGWDLFVMYGQTEATARMAYLPPDLAAHRPEAVGVPVPGGSFRLTDVDVETGVGELVYDGPNVMLGYAETPADLARGATVTELRTGDLARQADDGLWEVVGRVNRVAKVFGLRLDLEQLERRSAEHGCPVHLVVRGDRLWGFVDLPRRRTSTEGVLAELTRLPANALRVEELDRIPLTSNGKPDLAALGRHAETVHGEGPEDSTLVTGGPGTDAVRDVLATVLGRPDADDDDSFVSLGGDSLSYVEASARLSRVVGTLPSGWQHLGARELTPARLDRGRRGTAVEPSIVLRALAIVAIVLGHVDLVPIVGGAHVLLALVGFNLARFQLRVRGDRERVRSILGTLAWVAIPSMAWIGAVTLLTGHYRTETAFMLNGLTGSNDWDDDWRFWFLEVVVWSLAGVAALLAVPAISRWQRRHRYAAALTVVAGTLAVRYAWTGVEAGATERYTLGVVLWCVGLGWLAAESRTALQRAVLVTTTLVASYGFFDDLLREGVMAACIVLLLVTRPLWLPRRLAWLVGAVAAASLWIYLTHWTVYVPLEDAGHPWLALVASMALGVAVHLAFTRARPRLAAWVSARRVSWPLVETSPGRSGLCHVADSAARRSGATWASHGPTEDPEPQEQIMRIQYFLAEVMDSNRRHDAQRAQRRRRQGWTTLPQQRNRQGSTR